MKVFGLVIADDCEFAPVTEYAKKNGVAAAPRQGYDFYELRLGDKLIVAVCCGVGKTNAADATATLCALYSPDAVLNIGLSGALWGVCKNQLVLGGEFVEHDFDLTAIGYKPGVKPQQRSIFTSDERLCALIEKAADAPLERRRFATGDSFVARPSLRQFIIDSFAAAGCDMETAAIASVCARHGVAFASLRCMSDNADDDSTRSYRAMNELKDGAMFDIVLKAVQLA